MKMLCECMSYECRKSIDLSVKDAEEAHLDGRIIIVDGCTTGAESTDVLIEKKQGYSIFVDESML